MKKYLAFIEPLEDFRDKEEAYSQIRIMSGDLEFKVIRQLLKTTYSISTFGALLLK